MSQASKHMAPWEAVGTRVEFNQSTIADHSVVAAPAAGLKIRILHWSLVLVAANTLTWLTNTSPTAVAISSAFPFASGGLWECKQPWQQYECAAAEALKLRLGVAAQVQGDIWYEIVKA